jgi:hypothetical protein
MLSENERLLAKANGVQGIVSNAAFVERRVRLSKIYAGA